MYGDESKRWEKICHCQNPCVREQRATRPPSGKKAELHPTAGKCLKIFLRKNINKVEITKFTLKVLQISPDISNVLITCICMKN